MVENGLRSCLNRSSIQRYRKLVSLPLAAAATLEFGATANELNEFRVCPTLIVKYGATS